MSATELPPLPEPLGTAYDDRGRPIVAYGYTPAQMRDYALHANVDLAAESERRREFIEHWIHDGHLMSFESRERFRKDGRAALAAKDSP